MLRRFGPNYMLMLYLLDLACSQAAVWVAAQLRLFLPVSISIPEEVTRVPPTVHQFVLIIFAITLPMASLYDSRRIVRAIDEAMRVTYGIVVSSLILAGVLYLSYRGLSRLEFLYFVVVAIVLLVGYRVVLRIFFTFVPWATETPVKVLIAGGGERGRRTAEMLLEANVAIAGFADDGTGTEGTTEGIPVLGPLDEVPAIVEKAGITDVIFTLPDADQGRLDYLLVALWKRHLRIYTIPDISSLGFARAQVDYIGGMTVLGLREPVVDGFRRVAKRLLDLTLGTLILLCALPVMGIIAIAIRLDSPGPIVFRQQRVGENGRCFTMYKFRSMVVDAEHKQDVVNVRTESGEVVHKRPGDPRVTRVGRNLRRFSLDEIPQLINVLRGEMSLVGPRPELPWIVANYEPWQYQRLAVPQGMTSWYVVNGRSKIPMHLNTEEDLRYVREYSLLQDLKILWKSVTAVATGRGAF
jgi:exopolysaccharide biosynthesis polyprenyl glycosylphosphotransferase